MSTIQSLEAKMQIFFFPLFCSLHTVGYYLQSDISPHSLITKCNFPHKVLSLFVFIIIPSLCVSMEMFPLMCIQQKQNANKRKLMDPPPGIDGSLSLSLRCTMRSDGGTKGPLGEGRPRPAVSTGCGGGRGVPGAVRTAWR